MEDWKSDSCQNVRGEKIKAEGKETETFIQKETKNL